MNGMLALKQWKRMSRRTFRCNMKQYRILNGEKKFAITRRDLWPVYTDINQNAGSVDRHYFLQDIYMAKKVLESRQEVHFDVGSRIDGFIAHLLSSTQIHQVVQLDIRPFYVDVLGLSFIKTDATELNEIEDGSLRSVSSLHAIEHFGLGRYGDTIDPYAWEKAMKSIQNKLCGGGYFYFSCPVSRQDRLCFNAHRIFSPVTIIKTMDQMQLVSFAYIHEFKVIEVPKGQIKKYLHRLGDYDCGMFVFIKK